MCPSAVAVQFVEHAEAQAQSTLRTLWPTNPHLDDPSKRELCEEALARLKILYLFPQLPDWQRGLLASLYWQRQALERLLNHPLQQRPAALRVQTEHVTRQLEQSFVNLVGEIQSLHWDAALSPMQRAVLDSEFTHITFHASPCSAR